MPDWTLISNHGLVLAYIARHPQSTIREIAYAIKITEWTVHRIIAELVKEGYITRQKSGRRNVYYINPSSSLRHDIVRHVKTEDLLKTLGHRHPKSKLSVVG
jgi:DNA-binding MarR family transcriptional regulator